MSQVVANPTTIWADHYCPHMVLPPYTWFEIGHFIIKMTKYIIKTTYIQKCTQKHSADQVVKCHNFMIMVCWVFLCTVLYICCFYNILCHFNNKMAYFNSHLVLSLYRKSNIAEVCQWRGDNIHKGKLTPISWDSHKDICIC